MRILLSLTALGICLGACTGQWEAAQDAFVRQAWEAPRGFTRTDPTGRVLEEDLDDWRTAPLFRGILLIHPPYPNPTRGEDLRLPVEVLAFSGLSGGLEGWAADLQGRPVRLFRHGQFAGPGLYTIRFSLAVLAPNLNWASLRGLHRVRIFDEQGRMVTYGDVMLE
ncbi:MAG: hypothetical protein N2561_09355 [Bacteroidetes bacterium]|nr:hypothetical protein [Rhodothermia bacterium]MCX7907720.1 hypothetical protein [Bacteroidota bacterium]MDW8137849.1 hypothetical protein [Bacteroidota bacterium]MDW8286300.1 hypothetical protein [Bacteroidota bacterium]